jgi:hypothetical protein
MGISSENRSGFMRRFFVTMGILLFLCAYAAAAGRGDSSLLDADALIAQKRYSEAILALSGYITENNEYFDAAERRIRNILRQQDSYYKLIDDLIDTVERSPDNLDRIIAIADVIKKMEMNPSEEVERFVSQVLQIAQLSRNRRKMEDILVQGRALIDAGNYLGALRKYQTGFALFQPEMWAANFGAEISDSTRTNLNAVENAIVAVSQTIDPINSLRANFERMNLRSDTAANRTAMNNFYNTLEPQLSRLVSAKLTLARAENIFSDINERDYIANSTNSGHYFFSMAPVFIRGRTNESIREGMLGAVDALWRSAVLPLDDVYVVMSERIYTSALAATNGKDLEAAERTISNGRNFMRSPLLLINKSREFSDIDVQYPVSATNKIVIVDANIERFSSLDATLGYFSDAVSIKEKQKTITQDNLAGKNIIARWKAGEITTLEALVLVREARSGYTKIEGIINTNMAAIESGIARLTELSEHTRNETESVPVAAALRYYEDARRIYVNLGQVFNDAEDSAVDRYTLANSDIADRVKRLQSLYADIAPLVDGVEITTEQGQQVVAHYPNEATEKINLVHRVFTENNIYAQAILSEYNSEPERISRLPEFVALKNDAIVNINIIDELNTKLESDLSSSITNYARAEELRFSGERSLRDARAALRSEDVLLARESIENTRDSYAASLVLQENPALRREWALNIEPLAAEIARLEFEQAVREVRALVSSSRDKYYAGTFENAESDLLRAESRWATVRPTPNEEVAYWLAIVRSAISLRSGTSIPVSAPLYPAMSQLLNDAQQNFDAGISLLNSSKRTEGLKRFEKAREKAREVRLMFPINQEARLLELKIERELDPTAFNADFRSRFFEAVTGTNQGQITAYAELEALAKMNPSYPGIAAALTEAQYNVGLKLRPVSNTASSQTANLIARAESILATSNTARYNEALSLANQAIALDPTNVIAAQLRDRVQIIMARASTYLSGAEAEQEYIRAVREFQMGNNIVAMTIVQRLLQNPANANNVRYNELRRRIQATM